MNRPLKGPAEVWVKVCGITNRQDALTAIGAGADALGFNLWPGSKRCIHLEESASWIRELPEGVERIAVLVDAPLEEALRIATTTGIDAVQFHGNESSEYLAHFAESGRRFLVARRLGGFADISTMHATGSERILIDANVPGEYGGTGVTVDFTLASEFVRMHPEAKVILAGGLTPENVSEAVNRVHPYGVDVASGVECEPRAKDPQKVRSFIAAVKQHSPSVA